ncbi:hypothetical protein GN958_ATG09466 [Phytophthora infestans]|uniref:Uncharacterized protein n=1 Tax=Phytophthora infestans TaxID=4787 RepID=A0A8S9UKS0_PHYIN|nr:hypothetical protein GN958_ATG09466 [Phytophthora infestans]
MSAFLNCNRQFVNEAQCPKIRERYLYMLIPSSVKVGLEDDYIDGCELLSSYFSAESENEIGDDEA